jgi:hypothetical protein
MNNRGKHKFSIILFLLFFCHFSFGLKTIAQDDLDVIKNKWIEYSDAQNSLYHHLASQAYSLLEKRSTGVAGIKDLSGWQERQKYIRETLMKITGPFPEKTPLNAKILRTIQKEDYRVEHIVFESQPRFYVTSSLFIPSGLKKNQKAPAIIYCSGHSADGYRSAVYQHVIINLVKKGFIVFAFDPVGQGERLEYFNPETGKSTAGGPTNEHSYPGAQAFIAGSSQAQYMIWDGIRAVDYLISRKEVDPARIGITGRSGGGTQSAYIAAYDERIYAAAPENYITNFTRLLQTIGPQDAEQNLCSQLYYGIDHPDYLIVRAPKPAMMITTTRDMFSIQGARETEAEVSRIYEAYSAKGNFSGVEDDDVHASTKKNREAMYTFFRENLKNPGKTEDEEVTILTPDEIKVTVTGQISTSISGESVFSLNSAETAKRLNRINDSRKEITGHLSGVKESAMKLSGYVNPVDMAKPVFTGRIQKGDYVIEKYFIPGEGNYAIPYLIFKPTVPNGTAMIYLHPLGKAASASEGGEIEWFVKKGLTVLAPDLPGIGEMGPGILRGDANIEGTSHNIWYASILVGRSIVGIRTGDVVRLVKILLNEIGINEIYGLARKELTPVLLHAAVFEPAIKRIALIEPLWSYSSLVMSHTYKSAFIPGTVPGSLKAYDLPDLIATLSPGKLLIAGVLDGNSNYADNESIAEDVAFIRKAYQLKNSMDQLSIITGDVSGKLNDLFIQWIK